MDNGKIISLQAKIKEGETTFRFFELLKPSQLRMISHHSKLSVIDVVVELIDGKDDRETIFLSHLIIVFVLIHHPRGVIYHILLSIFAQLS